MGDPGPELDKQALGNRVGVVPVPHTGKKSTHLQGGRGRFFSSTFSAHGIWFAQRWLPRERTGALNGRDSLRGLHGNGEIHLSSSDSEGRKF